MFRKIALVCVLCIALIQSSCAQGYVGKEFFLSNMEYFYQCWDTTNPNQGVYITSPYAAKVQFSNSSGLIVTPKSATLTPNKAAYFEIPFYVYPLHYYHSDIVSNISNHLTSDSDITVVYAIQTDSFKNYRSKGSAAILPAASIPYAPEYIITTNKESTVFRCMGGQLQSVAPQIMVLGMAPLSKIEIIPKAGSVQNNDQPIKPFIIQLKQGETFYYVSRRKDLTGSTIRAKDTLSRFAVFAGDKLTGSNLPDSNGVACSSGDDYGMQQMLPTVSWGKSYTALPFKEMHSGYYLKVVACRNNTMVYVDGVYSRTLNEGEHYTHNVPVHQVCRVHADKPISVTQFMKGGPCSGHSMPKFRLGDYEQLNLTADTFSTRFGWISTISKLDFWYGDTLVKPENYVNILCNTADTASILLNGIKIRNREWNSSSVIPGKSYAQVYLDSGTHMLKSVNPFNYYVYGYGDVHAHAYQGHSDTRPLENNFIYNRVCKLDTVRFQALNTKDYYNFSWNFGDKSPAGTGHSTAHIYRDSGWYNTVLYFQHKAGNVYDSVSKRIYIAQAGPGDILIDNNNVFIKDTIVCGKLDLNVYAKDLNYANDYLWHDNNPNYLRNIKVPGEYSIRVKERNTCVSFDTIRIVNHPFPTAVFTSTDTGFCESDKRPVTFYNRSFSPDSIVRNVWDFGILDVENNDSVVTNNFNRPGQYLVKLRVYAKTGCWHDTFQQFTIYPSPHPRFEVQNLDSCFNTNRVSFINRTKADTTLLKWYKWYFSEGYVISRSNPAGPRTYSAPGTYTANLIYEYSNGCFDTAVKTITIYENPKAGFNVSGSVTCLGDSVKFINLSSSPHTPLSYRWLFGDADTAYEPHPAHLYAAKGKYQVKLTAVSPQSCMDSAVQQIFVSGNLSPGFSVNDTVQCLDGHAFRFYNTSVSDTGYISSARWHFPDGSSSSNPDSASKTFSTAGAYRIRLRINNSFGCSDSVFRDVRIVNNPTGRIAINDASQCENSQDFDFVFLPRYPADSISQWLWFKGQDSLNGTASYGNIQFPARGLHQVRVKTTSAFGCTALASAMVSVNAVPAADFSVPDTVQCLKGHAFTFSNLSGIPQGQIKSYSWSFGDNSSSAQQYPPPKTYAAAGQYLVELRATSDSGCVASDTMTVYVRPKANVQIFPIAAVCLNDSSVFNAAISGAALQSVRWEFGDNTASANMPAKHAYAKAGSYPVRLIAHSGQNCSDTLTAPSNAIVRNLPEVEFTNLFLDGKNQNTLVKFTNTSRISRTQDWDFESFGTSTRKDTTLDIRDSVTLNVTLRISDYNGCFNSLSKRILLAGPLKLFIPNVFSPNSDGHNDGFGPVGIQYAKEYRFTVFNRWGQIMFRTEDLSALWDGTYMDKKCPVGVYVYTLQIRDIYGKLHDLNGSFLLQW